ncbi:MAG: hypothetical protein IKR38_03415 [Bacteroidales bacterium]|nr:hypothetical protein [Bacteroidales bacterium]
MKKFLKYFLTLGLAAFTFAACDEELPELVNFTISADAAFDNSSLEATLTVTGDKAAPQDIDVAIFLDDASTFPPRTLEFAASVNIAAGSKEATAKVKISGIDALEGGKEYKAVFGAKVNDVPLQQKVTISYTKPEDPVTFRFSADSEFRDNIAMLKVDASREVKEETLVVITLDANSTMPAEALTIPELKIAKGERHGEIQVTLNPDILAPGQEYTAIFNATIGNDAIGTGTTSFSNPVKVLTLADLVALMPAENKATADFKGVLNDILVTYVSGSNVFLEDATSAMLLYLANSGLQPGVKLSGYFEGKVQNYNGLPEISSLTFKQEDITFGQGEVPAPLELTIADVLAGFDKLVSRRVKLTAFVGADMQKKGEYSIYQGDASMPLYINVGLSQLIKKASVIEVTGFVTPFNEKKQVKIFEESAINLLVPAMNIADIKALCTKNSKVPFLGSFEGMYVNYVLGNQHIYLEDASGAIRFYLGSGNTLKVGDKISGIINGSCLLDAATNGRPQISELDWWTYKNGKVEAAPESEMPQPVTGTLASFSENFDNLMFRRVKLENVVLGKQITAKGNEVTVTDDSGSFPVVINFTPSERVKAVPAGYKVSFVGTFDKASGKPVIKIHSEADVIGATAP